MNDLIEPEAEAVVTVTTITTVITKTDHKKQKNNKAHFNSGEEDHLARDNPSSKKEDSVQKKQGPPKEKKD